MAKALNGSITFTVEKLSILIGKVMYLEHREVENPQTKVKTKKVSVFSPKMKDTYDVTLPPQTDLEDLKENDTIDFGNVVFVARANGRSSFGNVSAYLTTSITAESVITDKGQKPGDSKDKAKV